jgi:hypothetical protein
MDTKLKFLITILIISFISCDEETCRTIKCGKLEDDICFSEIKNEFILQACKRDNTFCKIDQDFKGSCDTRPKEKSFPGGSCKEQNDCIFPDCLGDKCVGRDLDDICNHHGECVIGSVCRRNKTEETNTFCLPPLNEGEECSEDEECRNDSGCLRAKCTKYFSQEDETFVTSKYFCKSGYELNKICTTITNVNSVDQSCNSDEDCKYEFLNKTEVPLISDSCKCGFNSEAKRYCELGSNHQYYKDWVSSSLKLLNDTSLCHTSERENLGICVERTLTDRSFFYRKTSQYLVNNQTWVDFFPKLVNSDSCVKYVGFEKYNDSIVRPDVYQCPKFNCDSELKNCLISNNPFNEDGSQIKVSLSQKCKNDEYCKGLENVYLEDSVTGTCVEKDPHPYVMGVRLPGEDCDENHKCIDEADFKSTCVNKKCTGKSINRSCVKTTECLAGLFCNNGLCEPQVKKGGACKEIYDCENNLGCYNKKCIEFGTLKENANISIELIGDFQLDPRKRLFCEYGKISDEEDSSFCAIQKYAGETKRNAARDGFVKCNWGEKCSYTIGKATVEQDCECGFNEEGQGYCPLSQDYCKYYF